MKKVLSAILTLAISVCSLAVLPASAETASVSNMTWNPNRGEWNIAADSITCTTASGNRYAFSTERTAKTDNWTVSYDVKKNARTEGTEIADGGHEFYFGRVDSAFVASNARMRVSISSDHKARLYYNPGSTDSPIGSWTDWPEGTDPNSYNVKVSVVNQKCYIMINNVCIAAHDISSANYNYSGGCFAFMPSVSDTYTTTFSNIHLSVNNEPISVTGGDFIPTDAGFRTVNPATKWNTAFLGDSTASEYAEMSLDYAYISGNDQAYMRFGDTSSAGQTDYYELRIEPPTEAGRNFALWHIAAANTRLANRTFTSDEIKDLKAFNVKILLTPDNCKVYVDGISAIDIALDYNGGKFGLQALYTAARFDNIKINTEHISDEPRLVGGRGATVNPDGSITTSGGTAAWSRIIVDNLDTSKTFEMSYDIVHTDANYQWEFHFGVSTDNPDAIQDGYFLSINYSDNDTADDVMIMKTVLNEDGKTSITRVSGRFAFPETADMDNFNVTVKYLNGYVRIYIDGEFLCTSAEKLEMPGQNAFLRVRQCESTISLAKAGAAETLTGDVNMDNRFDSADLVQFRKYLLGTAKIIDDVAADCNNDGVLDIKDLIRAKKLTAEII